MECALSGASKTQVSREFKNRYKLHDDDIEYLLDCCSFKKKPKKIKYLDFYKNKLTNEEIEAVATYVSTEGKNWKNKLSSFVQ